MHREEEGKVIKPPMDLVTSGKIFRPSRLLLYKEWLEIVCLGLFFWSIAMVFFLGISYIMAIADWGLTGAEYWDYVASLWIPVNALVWFGIGILLLPPFVMYPFYVRVIEYSVISQSGETMPEVFVKKGLFNITKKHVPFRTITNISSRAGPFDRLFRIGTVEIETAGYSGPKQQGPEEKLEGIVFYEEVRDHILRALRRYRDPYTLTTEVVRPREEPIPSIGDSLDDEILGVLREIRDLLRGGRS